MRTHVVTKLASISREKSVRFRNTALLSENTSVGLIIPSQLKQEPLKTLAIRLVQARPAPLYPKRCHCR